MDLKDKIVALEKHLQASKQAMKAIDTLLINEKHHYKRKIRQLFLIQQKEVLNMTNVVLIVQICLRKAACELAEALSANSMQITSQIKKMQCKLEEHEKYVTDQVDPSDDSKIEKIRDLVEDQDEQSRCLKNVIGIMGIVGAFLIHVLIGAIYRWSIINPYLTSYYKLQSQPYTTTANNSIGACLSMLFVGFSMKIGFRLCMNLGTTKIMAIALFLLSVMLFIASLMPNLICINLIIFSLYGFS